MWRFLKKLEIELPYNPAIPLLGSFPSQPEGKIGLPRANPRGRLRSPSSGGFQDAQRNCGPWGAVGALKSGEVGSQELIPDGGRNSDPGALKSSL